MRYGVAPNAESLTFLTISSMSLIQNTPISFNNNSFLLTTQEVGEPLRSVQSENSAADDDADVGTLVLRANEQVDTEDDNVSITTRTEDDIVREAFSRVIDGSDGEEDSIVWMPRYAPCFSSVQTL